MPFSVFLCGLCGPKLLAAKNPEEIAKDAKNNLPTCSRPCLRWFPEFFTGCADALVAYSQVRMQDRTETLALGWRAQEFRLSAANRDGLLFFRLPYLAEG